MSSVFSERNMLEKLSAVFPAGTEIKAAVHVVVKSAEVMRLYANAVVEDKTRLIPAATDSLIFLRKSKECSFDAYLGISDSLIAMVPCDSVMWGYELPEISDPDQIAQFGGFAETVTQPLDLSAITLVYPIDSLDKCEGKKNWIGAWNYKLEFSCGDNFRVMIPRLGGLGGGMPNHARYRDAIVGLFNGLHN